MAFSSVSVSTRTPPLTVLLLALLIGAAAPRLAAAQPPAGGAPEVGLPEVDQPGADQPVGAEPAPTSTLEPAAAATDDSLTIACWSIAFFAAIAALVQARIFYASMIASDAGNPRMQEIAGYVTQGANAYLQQQYRVVAAFFLVIALLLAYAAFGLKVQSQFVPFAFLSGGFFSGLAGWFGMKTATAASSRTAAAAKDSLNLGLQVAFRSGAVMGLTVVGLGLLDITLWFAFLYWVWPACGQAPLSLVEITVTMLCFGMGASAQALFARVGGGIFTKAADVGADLVGKVEQGIPEDDPRNPATIADNVGDNVGDVAGMGADLYESYAGSILATCALGAAAFSSPTLLPAGVSTTEAQLGAIFLPIVVAGLGILLSIFGIYLVKTDENSSQKNLLAALGKGINVAAVMSGVAALAAAWVLMPNCVGIDPLLSIPGVGYSMLIGLAAGWAIGKWTEYVTSDEYAPTQRLADQAVTGPATIIIGGIADGMMSVWFPVLVIGAATLGAFAFASGGNFSDMNYFAIGVYGVGIAAVGMLSTLGITLATDAYGPIADNAGGNAEMSKLEPYVRERTDALDSLGNTTAATGKGFAIGSAALTALALLAAYVEGVRVGFDRWGIDFAEQVAASDDPRPGFYKLSNQFVVRLDAASAADGGAPGVGYGEGLLVMPDQLVGADWQDEWGQIADGSLLPDRPADAGAGPYIATGSDQLVWTHDGTVVQTTRSATLPHFSDYFDVTLMNPRVLVGVFIGAMATFVFCAMTMKAVGRAAQGMVEEVRRQFRELPGIMDGTAQPDYAAPVEISTRAAQREMLWPSLLGLLLPVAMGMLLGVSGVLGLLVGALTTGFCVAVFMANAGGAWDNAKKYIEAGAHGGKGTIAHKAAVVGDTVGDPFKDTSGPSLNILIKLMSMVSVVVAGLVVRYSLSGGSWF